jgi:hypothetical protein
MPDILHADALGYGPEALENVVRVPFSLGHFCFPAHGERVEPILIKDCHRIPNPTELIFQPRDALRACRMGACRLFGDLKVSLQKFQIASNYRECRETGPQQISQSFATLEHIPEKNASSLKAV